MAVPWGLVTLAFGVLYGWLSPGRQDKARMLWMGLWIGALIAVVFGILGVLASVNPIGLGTGALEIFLAVLILTVLFVIGTWIGDLIETAQKRRTH